MGRRPPTRCLPLPDGPISLSGCRLEKLADDGNLVLSRAVREDGGGPSFLVLAPAGPTPTAEGLARLDHVFALRDELDPDWATTPRERVQHEGRPVLLLDDPRDGSATLLSRAVGSPWDLASFLRVACGLAAALGRLHARGLIHKDIRPANLFVSLADGRAWLTGFGIASRLLRERQAPAAPEIIAGALAYMSPEQTGRMNRSIDSRSDLYSLGITLHEMATGALPFIARDAMEWIHCHIAREPPGTALPPPLGAIVRKLLAKNAEDRYPTAAGLEADLRRCLADVEARGHIQPFALGAHDTSDRLLVPEKLYGRDAEVAVISAAFQRVVTGGRAELVLVAGYPGIGKSSVVSELHKVLVPAHGLFASGKFDQYRRDIPYGTIAQASQGLLRGILGKNDAELGRWRERLLEAVGHNGPLLAGLIPELALVLGPQPAVSDLPPAEARNRFQLTLRNLIGAFASNGKTLVLFLDDLQWLDGATLELVESLFTGAPVGNLLVIGAYRDSEVGPEHPLPVAIARIREAGSPVTEVVLGPLPHHDVERLVADALQASPQRVAPLARLVHDKTGGNPFFAIQFLTGLVEEGLVAYDGARREWSWDAERAFAKGFTDNVVSFMVGKLERLTPATQLAVRDLGCLGNVTSAATLALVHGAGLEHAMRDAIRAGLVFRRDGCYGFVHDRVQEAAYALTPEAERPGAHLRIARRLTKALPAERRDEMDAGIFDIVNQYNRGSAVISTREEREVVAELNLVAGKRARAATAYATALTYFTMGRSLLAEDAWERRHALAFALELNRAECECLTGALVPAEVRLTMLAGQARDRTEAAGVASLRAGLYVGLGRSDRAVEICLEYLRGLGIEHSAPGTASELSREYQRFRARLGDRPIEALADLPRMTDPGWLGAMDVLTAIMPAVSMTDDDLFQTLVLVMANISFEHGNCDGSCVAYVCLNMVIGLRFGDYAAGYRFAKLGVELVERGFDRYAARIYMGLGLVIPWTQPMGAAADAYRRAQRIALQSGDVAFASYSQFNLALCLLARGRPLEEVQREADRGWSIARQVSFGPGADYNAGVAGMVRALRGLTPSLVVFEDTAEKDAELGRQLDADPRLFLARRLRCIRKLQASTLAGDHRAALVASAKVEGPLWPTTAWFEQVEHSFDSALASAAACEGADGAALSPLRTAVQHHRDRLAQLTESSPDNLASRLALVDAEVARLEDRQLDAERLYERAIRLAREQGFVQVEAMADELAAQFQLGRGFETIAHAYLLAARDAYLRWGAQGKVRQLEDRFPHLRPDGGPSPVRVVDGPVADLDLATVVKVSQAISAEIVLDSLVDRLLSIAVEHAGAGRGLLIVPRDGELYVEAQAVATADGVKVRLAPAAVSSSQAPESILRYVARTRQPVIIADASVDPGPFGDDRYMRATRVRSVLCLPLVKQTQLTGVLYLENNLLPQVFTPRRIALLDLLASQAAISLENARLHTDLRRAQEGLRRNEALLAEGQRVSATGSYSWRLKTDEITFSEQLYRIFEFDRDTPLSLESITSRVHPDDLPLLSKKVDLARRGVLDHNYDIRLRMPDGSVKHVRTTASSTRDQEGGLEFLGVFQDITERRLAEEALAKVRSDLAGMTRVASLGALTAAIAHEVNQPLSGIMTNASTCLRMLAADPPNIAGALETMRRTLRDTRRAADVIGRLRALFEKKAAAIEPVDLNDAAREVLALSLSELQRNRVILRAELADGLPPVMGDRIQIQQVILNLLLNASEAMTAVDDRPRQLVVRSGPEGDQRVRLTVQDVGAGIQAGDLDRLFEAFYTTKRSGMGIGLSVSRSIIESHGGRLWATSNGDSPGASFSFSIPVGPRTPTPGKPPGLRG
jgi:PAS domain S-box-containing protein